MALYRKQVTVLNGASESEAIDLSGGGMSNLALCAIICPSTVDAVTVSIKVASEADDTYRTIYDTSGAARAITQAANACITVNPADYAIVGSGFVKLTTSGNVAANRRYTLIFRDA